MADTATQTVTALLSALATVTNLHLFAMKLNPLSLKLSRHGSTYQCLLHYFLRHSTLEDHRKLFLRHENWCDIFQYI